MVGRVLLLEDDAALRESLAEVLEDQGYEVATAGAGAQAVAMAAEQGFDLIVTDIRMEGMSGLDALEKVKQDRPDIGSLVITGYSTEADSIRALQLGVGDYLKKPFQVSDFLHAVEVQMARRREERKLVRRERALRQTALWALETVARSLDMAGPPGPMGGLVETGRLAVRAALSLGLGEAQAEEAQLGFLMAALTRSEHASLPEFLTAGLPESVQRLAGEVELRYDEHGQRVSLAARLAGYLLSRIREEERADPEVAAAVESALKGPALAEESDLASALEQARKRRGLLSLGRALVSGGDAPSARQSFQSVLDQEPPARPTREGVEAMLALARLSGETSLCREAATRARSLAPSARGLSQLEAALALLRSGDSDGPGWLAEAEGVLNSLGPSAGASCAHLARRRLEGPARPAELQDDLRLLLLPEHLDTLYESAGWLLPWLVESPDSLQDATLNRALLLLARECPGACSAVLGGNLSATGRRNLAEVLARCGSAPARELLERLRGDADEEVRKSAAEGLTREEESALPLLRLHSLGPFTVYLGERRIEEWHSQKVRYLLACLAAHPGRPVSEDVLVDAFWPEDPIRGKNNLYTTSSNLRRALRHPGFKGELNTIPRTPAGLTLNPDLPRWHDLEELERCWREALAAARDPERLLQAWLSAARLYRGPYLEGCYHEWAMVTRNRLEVRMQETLVSLLQALTARERWSEVLEYSQQLLELEPCSQEAHLGVMKAYLTQGQPELALRQFETCRVTLKKELQLDPSPALLQMRQRCLMA